MTEKEEKRILNRFAKRLVFVSRDYTISLLLEYLNNSKRLPERIAKALSTLDDEQLFMLKYFLLEGIDTAFHDAMWSIESYDDHRILIGNDDPINVEDACDKFIGAGLTGSVLEFIDEFSKYNTADEFLETGKLEKVQEESK